MFSSRVSAIPDENRLTAAIARVRASGRAIVDLTVSNPTTAGLDLPADAIASALARGATAAYAPSALGLPSARTALARRLGCNADDIVLTASTSEAYAYLFKLLADPGDRILTARPAYPLLEHLAAVESCALDQFPLDYEPGHGWSIDAEAATACLTERTRALVVVHPNNPTGSLVTPGEARALGEICASRGIALVSDEVFLPYPLDAAAAPSLAELDLPCLTFALGGLSKMGGMPHLKLAWIRLAGPEQAKRQALARLELVADNFLSVATPVQAALGELLDVAEVMRERIATRTRQNLDTLRRAIARHPHVECLPVQGGWSAVLRVPAVMSDEDLAIRILEDEAVLVHPGHFFDFEKEGFLVVSLLGQEMQEAVGRLLRALGSEC
jgi:alanine-synthesizing transaminase